LQDEDSSEEESDNAFLKLDKWDAQIQEKPFT